jgi:hypothetical protein
VGLNTFWRQLEFLWETLPSEYDCLHGTPLSDCYLYSKIRRNLTDATSRFLGLSEYNNRAPNSALLDLVFAGFHDLNVSISGYPVFATANYLSPLYLDCKLTVDFHHNFLNSRRNCGQRE